MCVHFCCCCFSFTVRLYNHVCRRISPWTIVCAHQRRGGDQSGCHQLLMPLPPAQRHPRGRHRGLVQRLRDHHQGFSARQRICFGIHLRVHPKTDVQDDLLTK